MKLMKRRKAGKKETKWWSSEGSVERRRIKGSSSNLDAMQKVRELVVNERMLQGKRVKSPKEKKKVPGWSF